MIDTHIHAQAMAYVRQSFPDRDSDVVIKTVEIGDSTVHLYIVDGQVAATVEELKEPSRFSSYEVESAVLIRPARDRVWITEPVKDGSDNNNPDVRGICDDGAEIPGGTS